MTVQDAASIITGLLNALGIACEEAAVAGALEEGSRAWVKLALAPPAGAISYYPEKVDLRWHADGDLEGFACRKM